MLMVSIPRVHLKVWTIMAKEMKPEVARQATVTSVSLETLSGVTLLKYLAHLLDALWSCHQHFDAPRAALLCAALEKNQHIRGYESPPADSQPAGCSFSKRVRKEMLQFARAYLN